MSLSRRMFLGRAASTAAAAGAFSLPTLLSAPAFAQDGSAPQTPFEAGGRTGWTSHAAELDFFDSILGPKSPNRFTMDVIGQTDLDDCVRRDGSEGTLPVHLFAFGTDHTGDVATPGTRPTVYILCSQHGNEPAGREAGIELIRDLAFTTDPTLLDLLSKVNIIVTPTANPRGRQRNARENGVTDINRDHLNLRTREARAYAEAGNVWRPYMIVDHHEYGPGQPVLYDDDVLYLWPRNLNVDEQVRAGAKEFCLDYIKADCEAAGYTADEYGLAKVGPNYGPLQTPIGAPTGVQTAGDWDDGIARNATGLRNAMGILVESAVSARPHDPSEATNNLFRRVASQRVVMDAAIRHLSEKGQDSMAITAGAPVRRAEDGAAQGTVWFDGQDEAHPSTSLASLQPQTFDDPGAKEYRIPASALTQGEGMHGTLTGVLGLHEVDWTVDGDQAVFSMAQQSKNVIPLLLDSRAERSTVNGTASY